MRCVIWNFETFLEIRCAIWTFSNPAQELLIWNFQIRLETRYAIWNFWNLKLFKHVMEVAYLKLSDQTWKRGAIWNFWNLKLFKPIMGGCLFETFRWDLKWDVLFEIFETLQPITGVGYLNFSDETWNEMCYLKFWNLKLCSWNYLKLLMCPLRKKKFQLTLNLEVINLLVHRVDICC